MTPRSGAALVIALVVLAALLLLGLPFLFTQSSSLAGTRSFAHGQQALIGRASAENVGIAASAAAMDYHWRARGVPPPPALDEWTSLYWGLSNGGSLAEVRRLGETRVGLDLRQGASFRPDPASTEPTLGGVTISDEHGKLDPNHLDSSAWSRLLAAAGVADWDDGAPPADPKRNQLARALADLRFRRDLVPDGRITRLDQLLLAEPPAVAAPLRQRHGLTRAELAQVVPHLSLHGMAQARAGLIDLGTVINDAVASGQAMPDSLPPRSLLAHPLFPTLVGPGSVIVDSDDDGNAPGVSQPDTRDNQLISGSLAQGRALALDAPPPVNLHEASAVVRKVLLDLPEAQPPATTADPPEPSTLTALAAIAGPLALPTNAAMERIDALERPRTAFSLLDPLGIVQELLTANAFGSYPGEGGVSAGAPALPDPANGNALETVVVVDGGTRSALTVEGNSTVIHLTGGRFDRLPQSGYARLDGNRVPDDPLTQPGLPAREYIHFASSWGSGTTATLANVTRGLAMPPGSGMAVARRFFAAGLTVTILSARELPPLAIASPGIVTVETAATATDPAGRQTAQQARTVVAQTVAHEFPLEARWERQAQFHASLAQRQGSLLASFPAAVDRAQGLRPQEQPSTPPAAAADDPYADQRAGVRPAVLRAPSAGTHLNADWTAPLDGRQAGNDALRGGRPGAQEPALNYAVSDLFPEGLRLGEARRLAWLFAPGGAIGDGFFKHPPANNGTAVEILPRQFGFWVRPDASWTTRTEPVILLEVRGPRANAGLPLRGTPSSDPLAVADERLAEGGTALQNYLGLIWYPDSKEFVLAFGSGAIEHVADYGPAVPSDNYAITTVASESRSPAVDNASLGSDPVRYHPLAPARPQNRIEHHYRFSAAALAPGTWHLVQVAFSGTRPDHAAIVVDGLAGRLVDDATRALADGDHYALPRLRLVTPLPETHVDIATRGAEVYRVDAIELSGPAAQVLPRRGMVLIGNEYISYQRLSGNTLQNCWRARRQNSVSASKPAITEEHKAGDDVFPGGYRTSMPLPGLYTGGNTLAGGLGNGDTSPGSMHPYRVWAGLARAAIYPPVPLSTNYILPSAETSIELSGDPALIAQFPPSGYAMIDGDEVFFFTRAAGANVLVAERWQTVPGRSTPTPADRVCNSSTTIHLVSAALLGPDPTWIDPSGPAPQQPARFPPSGLLQLYDANGTTATHRAEWVVYDGLVNRGDVSYALNYQGFDAGQRGQRRTAFAARDLGDTVFAFPAGTRVLPVQNGPYTVETGDVLTVARQRLSPVASERPWQGVVRFAEKDGWGAPGALGALTTSDPTTGRPYDTNNSQFAFCEAVPEHLARQPVHLLCWPCWTAPRDLTTVNDGVNDNPVTLLDLLPWGNAWATGVLEAAAGSGDDRRVCLGADDGRDSHNIVAATPATMAIDALWSGTQPAQGNASLQVVEVQRPPATTINPVVNPATVWVDATETPAALVGVTLAIPGLPGTGSDHLLASVGGEVMALRHLRDPLNSGYLQRAAIVGRALLGSTARAHHGREPVLILPIGPVTPLLSTLSPTDQRDTDPPVPAPPTPAPDRLFPELDAPALMLMDADGSAPTNHPEVLMAPNRWVAPWLRGMYGTPVGMWTVTPGTPGPLVVGWWPRFPSALPRVVPSTWTGDARKAWTNALFRSRSYAWAGFPLRFHDATFYAAGTNGVPITASDFLGAQVEVIDDAGGQFQIGVRALDAGSDWQHARALRPQAGGGSALGVFDVSDVFAYDRFRRAADGIHRLDVSWQRNDPIPVDGAELRVTWHAAVSTASTMNGALLDLARHNRAPMIGAVRLRCQAPSRVLAIEAPR